MADISLSDLKALGESLQKKRAELQRLWKEQSEREVFWRREVEQVRQALTTSRHELASLKAERQQLTRRMGELETALATRPEIDAGALADLQQALLAAQAQVAGMTATVAQLQADLQAAHEELAEAQASAGAADVLHDLQLQVEVLQSAYDESQGQVVALEERLSTLSQSQPDSLMLAEIAEERDILQEGLSAWLELGETPDTVRQELAQLQSDLEGMRQQLIDVAGTAPSDAPTSDEREAWARTDDELRSLQLLYAELQQSAEGERDQLTTLQADLAASQDQVGELETALAASQETVQALQSRLDAQGDAEAATGDLRAELTALQAVLAEKAMEVESQLAATEEAQAALAVLRGEHEALSGRLLDLEAAEGELAALRAEQGALTARLADFEAGQSDVVAQQGELEGLKAEHAALTARLSEYESQQARMAQLQDELDALRDERDSLAGRLDEQEPGLTELARLQEAYAGMQARIAELEGPAAQLPETQAELAELRERQAALQGERDGLSQRLADATRTLDELARLRDEHAQLSARLSEHETLQGDLGRLQQEQAELQERLAAAESVRGELEQLRAAHGELEGRHAAAEAERVALAPLPAELETAREQVLALHEEISRLQAEQQMAVAAAADSAGEQLQALSDRAQAAEARLGEVSAELANLQATHEERQLDANDSRTALAALHDEFESMRQEVAVATQNAKQLELERSAWEAERERLLAERAAAAPAANPALAAELAEARSSLAAVEAHKALLESQVREAQAAASKIETLMERQQSLQALLGQLKAENESLRQAVPAGDSAQLQAVNQALSQQLAVAAGERDRLAGALAEAEGRASQARSLEEALKTMQSAQAGQPQDEATLARLTAERDSLAAEVATLRQSAPNPEDAAYWRERAESFEAQYQDLYWQRKLAEQDAAAKPAQADVDHWRQAAETAQAEVVHLQAALAQAQNFDTELTMQQVAQHADEPDGEGLSKAIAKQLGRVGRSLAKLRTPKTDEVEIAQPGSPKTLWVLGSAERGRQWAEELDQYLQEYGLNLVWLNDPGRLPQPWVGTGLVLFSDEPATDQWAAFAKERQIPSLVLEPTNLIRVKIAILDRFIRRQ